MYPSVCLQEIPTVLKCCWLKTTAKHNCDEHIPQKPVSLVDSLCTTTYQANREVNMQLNRIKDNN